MYTAAVRFVYLPTYSNNVRYLMKGGAMITSKRLDSPPRAPQTPSYLYTKDSAAVHGPTLNQTTPKKNSGFAWNTVAKRQRAVGRGLVSSREAAFFAPSRVLPISCPSSAVRLLFASLRVKRNGFAEVPLVPTRTRKKDASFRLVF